MIVNVTFTVGDNSILESYGVQVSNCQMYHDDEEWDNDVCETFYWSEDQFRITPINETHSIVSSNYSIPRGTPAGQYYLAFYASDGCNDVVLRTCNLQPLGYHMITVIDNYPDVTAPSM